MNFAFEIQLDLPASAVQVENLAGVDPRCVRGGDDGDVLAEVELTVILGAFSLGVGEVRKRAISRYAPAP